MPLVGIKLNVESKFIKNCKKNTIARPDKDKKSNIFELLKEYVRDLKKIKQKSMMIINTVIKPISSAANASMKSDWTSGKELEILAVPIPFPVNPPLENASSDLLTWYLSTTSTFKKLSILNLTCGK